MDGSAANRGAPCRTITIPRWRYYAMAVLMSFSVPIAAIAIGTGSFYLHKAVQVHEGGHRAGADGRVAAFLIDFHVSVAARDAINGFPPKVHNQTLERGGQVWPLDTVNASLLQALVAIDSGDSESYRKAKAIMTAAAFGRVTPPSRVGPLTAFSVFGEITARSQDEASAASLQMLELASLVGYHTVQHYTEITERSRWLHYAEASCVLVPLLPGCLGLFNGLIHGTESPDNTGRRVLMSQPLRLGEPAAGARGEMNDCDMTLGDCAKSEQSF